MKPDISEFSYGYALTEELVNRSGLSVSAAPLFPSLIQEGRSGGGYDVMLPFTGFPLFLQFKLSHCMVRDSAKEVQAGVLETQFYRMHLRPLRHSQQHNLLLALEASGHAVFYAAPHFHEPHELNSYYVASTVVSNSVFFRPSEIGALPDDQDHHIAFHGAQGAYFCSEPRMIREEAKSRGELDDELLNGFNKRPLIDGTEASLRSLVDTLQDCIKKLISQQEWGQLEMDSITNRDPRYQIGYLSRAFFGCDALLVGEADAGA